MVLLGATLVGTFALALVPAPYVIETPGPVYDTLGSAKDADGNDVPLITVSGAPTYPTEGSLSMLTVYASGSPDNHPSWLEVISGWFRPDYAVIPMEVMYPVGTTRDDSVKAGQIQMDTSKQEAIAAALSALDIDYSSRVRVAEATEGYQASEVLKPGDLVVAANGTDVFDVSGLRALIADAGIGNQITLSVLRDGVSMDIPVDVVASQTDGETPVIGILCGGVYDFPFTIDVQINDVGGPSAGMMFALGIIDTLTPGSLTGGENVAGTGEIIADGTVGSIGGIVQKAYGARESGAEWLFLPRENCDELSGRVPSGLREIPVSNLSEALDALDAISSGEGIDSLPSCSTP